MKGFLFTSAWRHHNRYADTSADFDLRSAIAEQLSAVFTFIKSHANFVRLLHNKTTRFYTQSVSGYVHHGLHFILKFYLNFILLILNTWVLSNFTAGICPLGFRTSCHIKTNSNSLLQYSEVFRENVLIDLHSSVLLVWMYHADNSRMVMQFVPLPFVYVWEWGLSPHACPLDKTVRLGLVRRHCYVSKPPWQCCHSPISFSFPTLVCGGWGRSHDRIEPHKTGIHRTLFLFFSVSLTVDHLS